MEKHEPLSFLLQLDEGHLHEGQMIPGKFYI